MPSAIIYDQRCGYCIAFIKTVKRLDRAECFRFCPFESAEGQKLLRAQFGKKFGFAIYVFTPRTAYWGPAAARHIVRSLGFPKIMAKMVEHMYPGVVEKVSKLSGWRRKVTYPSKKLSAPIKTGAKTLLR